MNKTQLLGILARELLEAKLKMSQNIDIEIQKTILNDSEILIDDPFMTR